MKKYVVISENEDKIGKYYFSGFKNYKPTFEPEWCMRGGYKVYSTLKSAKNAIYRLNGYYKDEPHIKSYVQTINC